MKQYTFTLLLFLFILSTANANDDGVIKINMKKVHLEFKLDGNGQPQYAVFFGDKVVIKPSQMGFELVNDAPFSKGFEIINSTQRAVDDSWKPVWGEVKEIRDHYQQLTVQLKQKEKPNRLINIVFRVFEDGVGFRYEFPHQENLDYFIISKELTEFNMSADHKAWWIPADYDTNEYEYTTSKLSEINTKNVLGKGSDIGVKFVEDSTGAATPLMLKTNNGLYINIHEAALVNFPAMQLHVDKNDFKLSAMLVPNALGHKAYLQAPFKTPWRTVIFSDHAADILTSKIILNLNEPSVIKDTQWIKPMKFVGVWWEMQTDKTLWRYANSLDDVDAEGHLINNGKHGANTPNVKKYIDFAAKNGIAGVLVEGWNTGWEDWFGNWKEEPFDFTTPYPDFNIKEVTDYAAAKGVKMIMHNETAGAATTYERYADTAFRLMNKFHYPAVKTGYVGMIIPRGEHHDSQWMINHYTRIAQKAADYKVMVDSHESNRPTGLHRTYPNWMASEAGRGNEYNAFSKGNQPEHETIMPFTRFIGGPMDYTPGIFKLKGYAHLDTARQVHTTLAKQLALYVVLYSPLQMAADLPENYEAHPDAFQFIKDVAVDWDDTKIVEAEPGDYITTARKEKGTANWFIGAITDENARVSVIPLNFLDKGTRYMATIYKDGKNADWKNNPEAYQIERFVVDSKVQLKINLAKGGGAAISIVPLDLKAYPGLKKYK